MSLIVATKQGDNAYLLTDGATYRENGAIDAIGSKVITLPGVCGAIAYEGRACADDIALMAKSLHITSALDLVRKLGALAREMQDWNASWNNTAEMLLCAAVYAPEVGPSLWIAWTGGEGERPGLTPGQERRTACYCNCGDPSDLLGRPTLIHDAGSFNIRSDGVALAQAARVQPWDEGVTGSRVGGFLELTTVGAAGAQKQKLHRWPDKVGKPIDLNKPRRSSWFSSWR